MPVFIGEYTYSLDEKGRVSIPTKLRDALGVDFILTRGLDGCVAAYSLEAWESLSAKIAALPTAKARDLKRFMFASATQVTPDKQGRVLISSPLRSYAELEKDVSVIGANDHVEIWDRDKWEGRRDALTSDYIADAMDEVGF